MNNQPKSMTFQSSDIKEVFYSKVLAENMGYKQLGAIKEKVKDGQIVHVVKMKKQ